MPVHAITQQIKWSSRPNGSPTPLTGPGSISVNSKQQRVNATQFSADVAPRAHTQPLREYDVVLYKCCNVLIRFKVAMRYTAALSETILHDNIFRDKCHRANVGRLWSPRPQTCVSRCYDTVRSLAIVADSMRLFVVLLALNCNM